MRVETFAAQKFSNKKIVILGLARQGIALARFFVAAGADVVVNDAAPAEKFTTEIKALGDLQLTLALGGHSLALLDGCDLVCLSGGVPPQIAFVQTAIERGIPLTNDSLLTLQMASALGLGPTVGITGSSGKTTTTTLVGEMLVESGQTVHVGGNIGTPLIDQLAHMKPGEPIVLELSSFQLELFDPAHSWGQFQALGPDVAAILNVTPNHLDRHPSMAAYADAKLNLLRHLSPTATVILGTDDAVTSRLGVTEMLRKDCPPLPSIWEMAGLLDGMRVRLDQCGAVVVPFGQQCLATESLQNTTHGRSAWCEDDRLMLGEEMICHKGELQLRGEHNVSNILAASAISVAAGAKPEAVRTVARRFPGVAHRLEVVAHENGITWINDSIATSPERALAGLRSFESDELTLVFLVGGKDKNLSWEALADATISLVDFVIGFGDSGPMFVDMVQERAQFAQVHSPSSAVVQQLDQAVDLAMRAATSSVAAHVGTDDRRAVVLLSPGGTSYDAYKDFEERGEHFRQLITAELQRELCPG